MQWVFPLVHQSRLRKRYLDRFSLFAGLIRWQTDWQTDRTRYSVGNNKRSALWRSQILLLSTATTSIYCSIRLDRSDQIQQSAAIFSCKTRRVALYVETHNNIVSKRTFPTGVFDRWQFGLFYLCLFLM